MLLHFLPLLFLFLGDPLGDVLHRGRQLRDHGPRPEHGLGLIPVIATLEKVSARLLVLDDEEGCVDHVLGLVTLDIGQDRLAIDEDQHGRYGGENDGRRIVPQFIRGAGAVAGGVQIGDQAVQRQGHFPAGEFLLQDGAQGLHLLLVDIGKAGRGDLQILDDHHPFLEIGGQPTHEPHGAEERGLHVRRLDRHGGARIDAIAGVIFDLRLVDENLDILARDLSWPIQQGTFLGRRRSPGEDADQHHQQPDQRRTVDPGARQISHRSILHENSGVGGQ